MGALDGRVAVITGAGRGIGREHALLFAKEGARVVVNDLGGDNAGEGSDSGPAHEVVDEITAAGGSAVANTANIATWDGAESVVRQAIDAFGRLDVLVNNAGILRDSFIAGMEESQWDAVIAVHLKGHFAMLRHAAAYWKAQSKAGDQPNAAVINTASGSGVTLPNPGQANYGSAKAAIAALTLIAAEELERYGVRVNAIAPAHGMSPNFLMPPESPVVGQSYEEVAGPWNPTVSPIPLKLPRPPSLVDNAKVALFLVSDDSAYISGATIGATDGGTLTRVGMWFEEDLNPQPIA